MKQYTMELSNRPDYTKPLEDEVKIVKVIGQDVFEAIEKVRDRFSEYENVRCLKTEKI